MRPHVTGDLMVRGDVHVQPMSALLFFGRLQERVGQAVESAGEQQILHAAVHERLALWRQAALCDVLAFHLYLFLPACAVL